MFAKLQELDIVNFSPYEINEIKLEQAKQVAKAVKAIIAAAEELESLFIRDIPNMDCYDYSTDAVRLTMRHLIPFDGITLIQKLTLRSVRVRRKALVHFFDVRSKNLVAVIFWHVISEDATWAAILDDMRALKWPHLQQFGMYCCHDPETIAFDSVDDTVQDYLLHKTDKNPRIDFEEDQT